MLLLLSYGATTCRGNTANLFDACKRQTRELDNDLELQGLYLNALIPSTALKYFMGPTVETDNQEYRPHFGTVDWASASLESFETACTKKGGVYRELDVFLDCVDYDGDYKTNPLVGDLRLEQNNAPYCFGVTCDDEHMRRLVEQDQEWTDPILPFKIENPQNPSTPCKGRVFTGEISNQWGCAYANEYFKTKVYYDFYYQDFSYEVTLMDKDGIVREGVQNATNVIPDFTKLNESTTASSQWEVYANFNDDPGSGYGYQCQREGFCISSGGFTSPYSGEDVNQFCSGAAYHQAVVQDIYCIKLNDIGHETATVHYEIKGWGTCMSDICHEDNTKSDIRDLVYRKLIVEDPEQYHLWQCSTVSLDALRKVQESVVVETNGNSTNSTSEELSSNSTSGAQNSTGDGDAGEEQDLSWWEDFLTTLNDHRINQPILFYGIIGGSALGLLVCIACVCVKARGSNGAKQS